MRVLITGGGGFQGSHVAEHCLGAGNHVTILNTPSLEAENNLASFAQDVSIVWGSITDPEIVEKAIRSQDVVFHLAARINVDESLEVPSSVFNVNIMGTFNVLEAIRAHGCRMIYVSSGEAYGSATHSPIIETAELRPHSPYAASKAAADRVCFAYWKTYGIDVSIVRPCNIYGPRQKAGKGGAVIPIFVERALARKPLVVHGTGEQRREYMHVDDLVTAYQLVLENANIQGEVINLGTGETPSIKEIAEFIAQRLGASVEYGPARPGEVGGLILDTTKARLLGFAPHVSFWDGLDRYIQWRQSFWTG